MTDKKVKVKLDSKNLSRKNDLLVSLLSSLVADIDPDVRRKFLRAILPVDEEPRPVIEMVEY